MLYIKALATITYITIRKPHWTAYVIAKRLKSKYCD